MANDYLFRFFQIQRQIFGVCPNTGNVFRLSDCQVYVRKKPTQDWMQILENEQEKIENASNRLDEREESIREKARAEGRRSAAKVVKKIDTVFTPRRLNPDDAKVIFHPVDYVVFNGMKAGGMKNVVLLDKKKKTESDIRLQKSIENTVEKERYEWVTIRIDESGTFTEE